MKKILLLTLLILFSTHLLMAQKIDEDKYIAYLKNYNESQFKTLFETNAYTIMSFQEKYPSCLEGYTFYTNSSTIYNSTKYYETILTAQIKNGGFSLFFNNNAASCKEIVYTLTAKDRQGSECLIFIGSAGLIYVYTLFRFEYPAPISLAVGGISLLSNTVNTAYSFGVVADNDSRDNNKSVDFKSIVAKTCTKSVAAETPVSEKVSFDIKPSANASYKSSSYNTQEKKGNEICNEFINKKDINGLIKFLETKPDLKPAIDYNWGYDNPIMEAIYLERTEMIPVLLDYGADPNVTESFVSDERPISLTEMIARKFSDYADIDTIIPQLLEHGLRPTPENLGNMLFFAINFQHLKSIKLLVEKGADLNLVYTRGTYKKNKKSCKQLGLQSKNAEIKAYFKQLNKKS